MATRLFLLSHVDPLFVIEITDRAVLHPNAIATPNAVMFGMEVEGVLRPLIRRLVTGALDNRFLQDLFQVVVQSHMYVDLAGLDVLREMEPTFEVLEAPEPLNDKFAGMVRATDAACDLILQPLMAFSNFFNHLAGDWPKIAANPELSAQVFYQTNQSSYYRARLENLIRRELGLANTLLDSPLINIP